jgi:hypothetical protein
MSGAVLEANKILADKQASLELSGYLLTYNKRGNDQSGKCTIEPNPETSVWGVIYRVRDSASWDRLDAKEYLSQGHYEKIEIPTKSFGDVITYVASKEYLTPKLPPSMDYQNSVIAGALEHQLPKSYIDQYLRVLGL